MQIRGIRLSVRFTSDYFFFLCLFLRKRFLRLCVAILCLLRFLPHGILQIVLLQINYYKAEYSRLLNLLFAWR